MTRYLFVYHGGKTPDTPEEGERAMAAWGAWFGQIGAALVVPGDAVGKSHTVAKAGTTADGGANPASGYSVIEAATLEAALQVARGCPMVADGSGSVEVAPIIQM